MHDRPCFKIDGRSTCICGHAVAIVIELNTDVQLWPQAPCIGKADLIFVEILKSAVVELQSKIAQL